MWKYLILILFILSGCGQKIGADLQTVTFDKIDTIDKEKIIYNKEIGDMINYHYLKDTKTDNKYFFKEGEVYSNTKIVTANNYYFYPGDVAYKNDKGDVYEIVKDATTTKVKFDEKMKETAIDEIISFFKINKVNAVDYEPGDERSMYSANATFSTAHDDATADTLRAENNTAYSVQCEKGADNNYYIERLFMNIDTSAIGAGKQVDFASTTIKSGGVSGTGVPTFGFFNSNHTNVDDANSFNDGGTTPLSDTFETRASWTANSWHTFNFNTYGKSYINMTGTTYIVFRENTYDVANSAPPSTGNYTYITTFSHWSSGNEPYLSVTFSDAEAPPASNPCSPTAGQPFFQTEDCYLTTDVFHNNKWITNGYKLINKGGKLILD